MATQNADMRGPSAGKKTLSHKIQCVGCGKTFTPNEEEDAKRRFSEDGEEFICEMHRNQLCNDCFDAAVAENIEIRALRRSFARAMKTACKRIYGFGDESEDEDDEAPSGNVQRRQIEKPSSKLPEADKTCAHCGKVGDLDRCSKCKVTYYCCRSHQAADYAKHKANCQAPNVLVNVPAQPTKTGHDENPCEAPDSDTQSTSKVCAYCGVNAGNLSRCARCKCTWYCSAEHQKAHYPEHKRDCRMIANTAERTAQTSPQVPMDQFHLSKGLGPFGMSFGNRPTYMENEDIMPEESQVISWKNLG
ncbi:hypothetical protein KC19_2G234200 [Ceratodon purpureus]|uniref:MYND-type domain-containing protein n=1 Tax=Ceratodon purpureus TaxID=3225 RepID=A0A8T0IX69_CERPU|nr:hypothetical protein KC19_2G234200 [Ceratodon purpureus]KAG0588321.1 hypothetical protein KC19_2G234200 [Ceratodon purpureus]